MFRYTEGEIVKRYTKQLLMRLTPEQDKMIKLASKKANLEVTAFCRKAVLDAVDKTMEGFNDSKHGV